MLLGSLILACVPLHLLSFHVVMNIRSAAIIKSLVVLLTCATTPKSSKAQLILDQTQVPDSLVQNHLIGSGVTVSNVSFCGNPGDAMPPVGIGPSEIGHFNGINSCVGLDVGVFLCTNVATHHLPGPNDRLDQTGGGLNPPAGMQTPDVDLSQLTDWPYWMITQGGNIYNKAVLEFDFVPINDMVSFRYVFSSEEYERWACSAYNDVFGMFISGPGIPPYLHGPYPFTNNAMNIAFIPGSMAPVCINTVNSGLNESNANGPWTDPFQHCFAADSNWQANAQYYRYNGGEWQYQQPIGNADQLEAPFNEDPYYIQHNGMTVVLTASAAVQIGQTYHMKMALGNVLDSQYPSAVFLEGNSFACGDRFTLSVDEGPNVNNAGADPMLFESDIDSIYLRFNRWGGFYLSEDLQIAVEGTATAGVDYLPILPDAIHFDQLDSAVVVPIAIPVRSPEIRELTIHLITSNGDKVMTYDLIIAPEIMTGVEGVERAPQSEVSAFPNPAQNTLFVSLPTGMEGATELELLDMAGRVVAAQAHHAAAIITMDLSHLPNGLYVLKAYNSGRVSTTRVNVRQ